MDTLLFIKREYHSMVKTALLKYTISNAKERDNMNKYIFIWWKFVKNKDEVYKNETIEETYSFGYGVKCKCLFQAKDNDRAISFGHTLAQEHDATIYSIHQVLNFGKAQTLYTTEAKNAI